MKNILVIDDDKDLRFLLKKIFSDSGFFCYEAGTDVKAFEVLETNAIDLVLCDMNLRKANGKDVLVSIKEQYPALPVIIITGYSNVRMAVEMMRLGAMDYLIKPLIPAELVFVINKTLSESFGKEHVPPPIPAASPSKDFKEQSYVLSPNASFQEILKQISLVAPTDYSIIIYGESGSGKEAFAQEIHKRSKRKSKPFLAIDCGALNKELSASILFGHEKGAFTGAMNQKEGAFESAHGGTVFLDEITNLAYETQVSLLRVMQERKTRRVGGTVDIPIDVRIIVASNKKLWDETKKGYFREDLYHRFNEFSINILPLRERKEDIEFYADHFLKQSNNELGKAVTGFTAEAMQAMLRYHWPGNLRELKNLVKRSVLITESNQIGIDVLPLDLFIERAPIEEKQMYASTSRTVTEAKVDEDYSRILNTLKETGFDKKKTGWILKMDIKTLNEKIKVLAEAKKLS